MFAVVEDQQDAVDPEIVHQDLGRRATALLEQAQRRGDRLWQQGRVVQRGQVDEADPIGFVRSHPPCPFAREPGLADAG